VSQSNPYAPSHSAPHDDLGIRKVKVRVWDLFRRSFRSLGDQYWLFLGITLLGMLIGSAVPMGLIMGPVLVGIYACYIERERTGRADFQTMFKGFENFLEPFLFTFQLIADRNLKGIDAVKLSVQGTLKNFWGVLWCLIVVTFVALLGALMCYLPLFLLMPVTFGVFYVLYRDIYGPVPLLPEDPWTEVQDAELID